MSDEDKKAFAEWALVELMGRQRIFGYVTEVVIFGAAMMRVDVPDKAGETVLTRFYGASAIYAVSPITKAACLAMVDGQDAAPIKQWELPAPALEDVHCDGNHGGPPCKDPNCWINPRPAIHDDDF